MVKNFACLLTGIILFVSSVLNEGHSTPYTPPPTDSIAYTGSNHICQGNSLALSANYAPSGASFQWTMNGNNIAGATSQNYNASASGNYSVIVMTPTDTLQWPSLNVQVHAYPVAGFSTQPSNQCANTPVQFTNTSTGASSYTWNFGDPNSGSSNTSSQANPTHAFVGTPGNASQNFTVSLIADMAGCKDTITSVVTVKQLPGTEMGGTGYTTYNGLPYFTQCASTTSNFTFTNQSSTVSTNTNYVIKWGDNTADFTATSWSSVNHTYGIGTYQLQFIVTGGNGCIDTTTYYVFVGNNPAVGLNNPGNTFICSGTSLTFPISGTGNNPPGTIYTVTFNDGTPPTTLSHPAPADVTHQFAIGSCGTTSSGFANSYQASIQASNPCGTSAASVVPIYVSQKGTAIISTAPADTVCTLNTVSFTNMSQNAYGVSSQGVCSPGKGIWTISPATGWTLTSGALGNDFGQTDPTLWQNGSTTINVQFSVPGVYSIKLKLGATNLCSADSTVETICVNPPPTASFALSASQGCAPFTVSTTNNSNVPFCGNNRYQWAVSYSNASGCQPNIPGYNFINGTNDQSPQPEFQFTNPGVYTISLVTTTPGGTCSSAPFSQTVTVKEKPSVNINAPTAICQNGSINPAAIVFNCFGTTPATYQWSFPGGIPSGSTNATPGNILYNTAGPHVITLTVTNECGSTTVTQNLSVNPAPNVVVPSNQVFCAGTQVSAQTFTSSQTGTSFSWTNSHPSIGLAGSGTGNLPAFTAQNTTGAPVTATITVVPSNSCTGTSQSFTITVNPIPAAPVAPSPVVYCLNEQANPLTAFASGSNTITWYSNPALTNALSGAPTPATSTAGNTQYYVTQTNAFNCASPATMVQVNVLPPITGNSIVSDQTICSSSSASMITQFGSLLGGNNVFSYMWQQSTDGGSTWTTIPGANIGSYQPASVTTTTKFRRIITSGSCVDTSNVVTITLQGNVSNADIAASQTICQGTAPSLISGQLPVGGNGNFSFQWESSANNLTWTSIPGAVAQDYQPPVLNATTYYRRKTTSGPCNVNSSVVTITVNPKPVISPIQDLVLCMPPGSGTINFTSTPAGNFNWTNSNTQIGLPATGTGNIALSSLQNNSNPKIPLTGTISVTSTLTNNGISCVSDPEDFIITTLPLIQLAPVPDTIVCTGTALPSFTPQHDAGIFAGSTVSFNWTVTGSGTSLTSGSGTGLPAISTLNNGTTDLVTTIVVTPVYQYNGSNCSGTPETFTITVKPGTPSANAGADTVLCNATSYTMNALQPSGTTGTWTQLSGPAASISQPASPVTSITGLVPGVFIFEWSVSGFATCPPAKDTVVIQVDAPVTNQLTTSPPVICAGQSVSLQGNPPAGGNGSYQYQWEQSTDNINWTVITGQTGQSLTFSPAQDVYIRRVVYSLPCVAASNSILVTVQPGLSNNNISADHAICINTPASLINGSIPSGGNGAFVYQWQQSADGGASWSDITGATSQDYQPGILSTTMQYRRLVSTSLCNGPQSNVSNTVTITVNPDASAVFNPVVTDGCIPFQVTPAIINLQTNAANGQYTWYVNNVFIGNGSNFPGYTMTQPDDTITIRLVAISAFGCKSDSMSHEFHTYKIAQPSFTLSDTTGCGPLTVTFNNTTPETGFFSYYWDFGNGLNSTAQQPGNISFLPNPNFGDTIYTVTLHAISQCDTVSFVRNVHVKSKPKALFAPNSSVGCSPMTVVFNNISAGIGNTYTWNFGDGSAPVVTNSAGQVTHTFYTGIQDTFFVKLVASNICGADSLTYAIVVSPNAIVLDFAINGNQFSGCAPHTVQFINNTSGASAFNWSFGDGNSLSTTQNIDTVLHTYLIPGTYTVTLHASNGCSDTTTTENVIIYPRPQAAFSPSVFNACIGNSISFTNASTGATSYLWHFGDGNTSTLSNPSHIYTNAGVYTVQLIAYSLNASGTACTDTATQQLQVGNTQPGVFSASSTVGNCTPFTVQFNNQNLPSVNASWDFGDGNTAIGNTVSHTYTQPGTYIVTLNSLAPGGCTYQATNTVTVLGPSGTWNHTTGYVCNNAAAFFQVQASNYDSLIFNFGDGIMITTTSNQVFHTYSNGGIYLPSVTIKNNAGCQITLKSIDTIRVDKLTGGFVTNQQSSCGSATAVFTDTTLAFFGTSHVSWNFGDGTTGSGTTITHQYNTSGVYPVQMIVTGMSGCSDTVTKNVTVVVYSQPVASLNLPQTVCSGQPVQFTGNVQSVDAINITQWTLSNGVTHTSPSFSYAFNQAGVYTVQLIAGTINGCYDTVSTTITVNPSPSVMAANDVVLCSGNSAPLSATGNGVSQWSWSPLVGLSCYNCPNPIASPLTTTPYVVQGTNSFGCSTYDTLVVTVIQPVHLSVAAADSICVGESTNLLVSGATQYAWTPANGLNNTTIPNPTASPTVTTTYRVVGYDGFNCFTDTAFITVAVGQWPTVSLGPDVIVPTGTQQQLMPVVTNGPIAQWQWSPATDLSCNNCAAPVATVKKDITYVVKATTPFGCQASDTIHIKTFCESAQVFIPNAFTPDGDGFNDVFMVRASGIAMVKTFRIFNRWGELVFERSNFAANQPAFGWDGRIKGVASGPDVFVYTAEVICDNGSTFTYKGNVTILK